MVKLYIFAEYSLVEFPAVIRATSEGQGKFKKLYGSLRESVKKTGILWSGISIEQTDFILIA